MAKRYWSTKLKVLADTLDPRKIFDAEHFRVMHALKRQHGLGVNQIAPITMHEARNATHFADPDSVRGVASCLAFCIGVLLGGRRPRSLTAMLLEDLHFYVGTIQVNGADVLIPCLRVKFRQEKFDCKQGAREATDEPHYTGILSGYCEEFWVSPAFWAYRLLVMRGCFAVFDPLLTAQDGDTLHVKPECLQYYLFCDVQANYWIDTAPTSVGTIGNWNKSLLYRLGTTPRGVSAHRSGFVSRTCILAMMSTKGLELPLGTLELITRWGGRQVVTGTKTVMDIYARKIVDQFFDPYCMINGYEGSDEHWARKRQKYLGQAHFPKVPFVDKGRTIQPLQLRVLTWRSVQWSKYQTGLNLVCSKIMEAALADDEIMPIHRHRQLRRAFNLYLQMYEQSSLVQSYRKLMAGRVQLWKACVKGSTSRARDAFFACGVVSRPEKHMFRCAYLDYMRSINIGYVSLKGEVVQHKKLDPNWDTKGIFSWL